MHVLQSGRRGRGRVRGCRGRGDGACGGLCGVVGGSRAAQDASASVPACALWNGLDGRCVRAVQGSPGGPEAGLGGPGPPRWWSLVVLVPLVAR